MVFLRDYKRLNTTRLSYPSLREVNYGTAMVVKKNRKIIGVGGDKKTKRNVNNNRNYI